MIRNLTVTVNKSSKFNIQNIVQSVANKIPDIARRAVESQRDSLIRDISKYPAPAVHPFAFATAKSRRWYFAQLREGKIRTDGTRYVRSGGYAKSWQIIYRSEGATFYATLFTAFDAARFIGGTLQQDASAAARRIVPGHKNTGWMQTSPIAWRYVDLIIAQFKDDMLIEIGKATS